jgi:hypothetical protein
MEEIAPEILFRSSSGLLWLLLTWRKDTTEISEYGFFENNPKSRVRIPQ